MQGLSKLGEMVTRPFRNQKHIVNSYKTVFTPEGYLSEDAKLVLGHLGQFCGCEVTDYGSDPTQMARMSGRLEAFNWIKKHVQYKDTFKLEEEIREFEEIYKDE